MNAIPNSILDATRLTREGRLIEAMAALRGDAAPVDTGPTQRASGQFLDRSHASPAGQMAYKLYIPADARPGAALIVMLHGCTQSPDDFACGTGMNALADARGFLVAYPAQTQSANAQKCWNWFAPAHQQRDRGEPALIAGLTRDIIAAHGIDPARVFVAGLSAGGAAAAIMAEAYPDLYAAVGIHSGLACGAARDLSSALQAMQRGGRSVAARPGEPVPTIIFHGDRDTTVNDANAGDIVARAGGGDLRTRSEAGQSTGGRRYTRTIGTDAAGHVMIEQWTIHGGGHAWSGGNAAGSYTDPTGPNASAEMVRFFMG